MTINVGQPVYYVDEKNLAHHALVTAVWNSITHYTGGKEDMDRPGVNLVMINPAVESMTDQYGTQILRETSVVHQKYQPANGRYWMHPEEK